jgi:hypothetical protein
MVIKLGNVRFKVCRDDMGGYSERRTKEPGTVWLNPRWKGKDGLEAAIHEAMHQLHPRWSHKKVYRVSRQFASYLWRLGYRVKTQTKS